jgi:hypothetical protein
MWRAFCETLKDCGRNGGVFILAILSLPLVVGAINFCLYRGPMFTASLGLVAAVVLVVRWRERRNLPPPGIAKLPPLSHADWQLARSKLLKVRNK